MNARTAICFTLHHTVRFTPILARDFDCLQVGDDTIVIIKSHRLRNVQRAFRSLLSNASLSGRSMSISPGGFDVGWVQPRARRSGQCSHFRTYHV